jgi:LysR family transcriptional activator of glutamate synthase operon
LQTLRSGLISQLLAALDAGDVDLVLGPIHADLPSQYAAHPLVAEQLVFITPPGHRLARERRLKVSDLRDEPFVCLPRGSGLRAILAAAAAAEGFEPRVPFETASPTSIRELVSAGLGVALLARSAALAPRPPVNIHALDPAPAHPPIGVIHHRDRRLTPAAQTCRRYLAGASTPSRRMADAPTVH